MPKKLYHYGGYGFENFYEIGAYRVDYLNKSKYFTRLSLAQDFYNSINEEKSCWCLKSMDLIDCHVTTKPSESNEMPF